MPKSKDKVLTAIFDIKPVYENGGVDFEKISRIQPILNLGKRFRINKSGEVRLKNQKPAKNAGFGSFTEIRDSGSSTHIKYNKTVAPVYQEKLNQQEELERYLNKELDIRTELISIGAEIHENIKYKVLNTKYENPDYEKILSEIKKPIKTKIEEVFIDEDTSNGVDAFSLGILTESKPMVNSRELDTWLKDFGRKKSVSKMWFLLAGLGLLGAFAFVSYGSGIKKELTIEGSSAVANLENAGQNIKKMDFVSASGNFAQAYQEFSKAGDNMNFMGAGISSLLSDLPGAGKLKSAKNLVEVGKLMANAGQAMSDAMGELAKTNLILNPLSPTSGRDAETLSIGEISTSLKKALMLSQKNLGKAKQLLADVDDSSIPEDKKASFEELKSKLPLFEKLINDSADYANFLEDFIGTKGTKKYLILFQNPSELRPTGGFPGTYGVVSFKDGKLQDFKVDDVYNLDGQLKELIVPPIQIQHITPNWGMRDANWFVDFPMSARKITTFFKKESGYDVDGVITFSPQIVAHILDIVGPVEMPEYNLTLDSKNLLSTLQEEVEYKGDRKQPKKIIMDLAPKMLKKIYSAESGKWLEVFNMLLSSMEQKDILMYFRDLNLESFSVNKGFSGQVINTNSDYLMVTFTNVKGSKTDLVMNTSLKIATTTESGDVRHKVSITRTHNGGDNKYGFYNKQSPTYVRVLVPANAEFVGLTGNSRPDFKPLIDYTNSDFKKDDDLARFEGDSYTDKKTGVTIYKEAGKMEFGFWMIINPGETKTADLEYTTPSSTKDYQFYVQKQPSLDINDFKFYMDGKVYYDGPLDKDMVIRAR